MVLLQIAPTVSHPVVMTSKDFFVEVLIHCLLFRHKLVMDQSFLTKKSDEHHLDLGFGPSLVLVILETLIGDFASSSRDRIEKPMFHLQ